MIEAGKVLQQLYRADRQITVIDKNGIRPRPPVVPNTRRTIPTIDMRYMTPAERQRLRETLRRNDIKMMLSPTPPN
ncbi:MAG: hypothetical protein ABI481_11830 [Pyrinomonadaceae bacterium]